MAQQRLIMAIGRIERALSRLEQADFSGSGSTDDPGLRERHNRLQSEAKAAVDAIDRILSGQAS